MAIAESLDAFRAAATVERHAIACVAIGAYAETMRNAGVPVERVIIALKEMIRRSGLTDSNRMAALVGLDPLIQQFVSCGIHRYYASPA